MIGGDELSRGRFDATCGCAVIVVVLANLACHGALCRRVRATKARNLALLGEAASGLLFASGALGLGSLALAASTFLRTDLGIVARAIGAQAESDAVVRTCMHGYQTGFVYGGLALFSRSSGPALWTTLFALMGLLLLEYTDAKAGAFDVTLPACSLQAAERPALVLATALTAIIRGFAVPLRPWLTEGPTILTVTLVGLLTNVAAIHRLRLVASRTAPGAHPWKP